MSSRKLFPYSGEALEGSARNHGDRRISLVLSGLAAVVTLVALLFMMREMASMRDQQATFMKDVQDQLQGLMQWKQEQGLRTAALLSPEGPAKDVGSTEGWRPEGSATFWKSGEVHHRAKRASNSVLLECSCTESTPATSVTTPTDPQVTTGTPQTTPDVTMVTAGTPQTTPDVTMVTTGTPQTTPDVTMVTTGTPQTTPDVTMVTTGTPQTTPDVTMVTTGTPQTPPDVTTVTTGLPQTTPEVTTVTTGLPQTTPDVTMVTTGTPQTTPDVTMVTTGTPQTTPDVTMVTTGTPQTTPDVTMVTTGTPQTTPEVTTAAAPPTGGNWTVIQRRQDGSVPFNRTWEEYRLGFGNTSGEYWLGNENIHLLTSQKDYTLRVDLMDWGGNSSYTEYSFFRVSNESDQYRLHISGYSGTAGDSMGYNNGQRFSTRDRDNDASSSQHCSQKYGQAGWWFGDDECSWSYLNGRYLGNCGNSCTYQQGVLWVDWRGWSYSLKSVSMKIRPN
ncbi:angiopoietin-related protein 2-like isoform X2 [Branchiostoma floridae]|uniref:Angiopoietin-related protein 2-like isoform X2 n=1 Tax=Branchiostoma floridae TaxID=7739 RepID=A0A9J7HUF6_BRAFL|nr:angiopoietin-related protein 2-like isoform X2 [Branchiostoma floridae]